MIKDPKPGDIIEWNDRGARLDGRDWYRRGRVMAVSDDGSVLTVALDRERYPFKFANNDNVRRARTQGSA